jgi:2-dehydro-3-deoxyphosphogluconate aldolase/(4S)-4-hydroxy-2-oxoglutarate aldolase
MTEKEEVIRKIHEIGAIGVLRVESSETCLKVIDALVEGGVRALEVTTTTPDTIETIAKARKKYGDDAVIGIGTVLDGATAEKGILAGAQLVVSPSLHKDVLDTCIQHHVVGCPGTFTPTEIVQAQRWGADLIKVFPASVVGPGFIRAVLAPLPWAKLVPTGGVDVNNAPEFIRAGAFCVGVGGALVSAKAIAAGRFDLLTSAARDLIAAVARARAS